MAQTARTGEMLPQIVRRAHVPDATPVAWCGALVRGLVDARANRIDERGVRLEAGVTERSFEVGP